MKFDYGVTNGECVDKKKFGEQNLKKEKKTNCLPCAAPLAHGKVSVCVCQHQAHGKPRLCRVPNGNTRQTLTAGGGR